MTDEQLLEKAYELEGLTFLQLAKMLKLHLPLQLTHAKGWLGQAIETFLGASAGSKAIPDFPDLGIELKTLPLGENNKVLESTYVTTLNLRPEPPLLWETSACYQKLKKVLWIPIEGDRSIAVAERRIAKAILWQPNQQQNLQLKADWCLIMDMLVSARIEEIDGRLGEFLHVRPKAANASVSTMAFGEHLDLVPTLPRGFYLRAAFTQALLRDY